MLAPLPCTAHLLWGKCIILYQLPRLWQYDVKTQNQLRQVPWHTLYQPHCVGTGPFMLTVSHRDAATSYLFACVLFSGKNPLPMPKPMRKNRVSCIFPLCNERYILPVVHKYLWYEWYPHWTAVLSFFSLVYPRKVSDRFIPWNWLGQGQAKPLYN